MEVLVPDYVEKEKISHYTFTKASLPEEDMNLKSHKDKLYRAMILGNAYRRKVRIIFETTEGTKQVETTIWATTDRNIILKGGVVIPISSIVDVDVY